MSIVKTVSYMMRGVNIQRASQSLGILKATGVSVKVCGRPLNNIESLGPLVRNINDSLKYSKISEIDVLRNLTAMGTWTTAQEIAFMGFHSIDATRSWDHVRFCSESLYNALRTLFIVKRGPGLRDYLQTEKKFFQWANYARTPIEKGFVVKVLLDVSRQHDEQTAEHNLGTISLASAIARQMGLSDEEISQIELESLLHDIGKVGVPKDILHKAATLTANDWEQLRMHVKVGVYLIDKIKWMPRKVIDAVLYHHYYKNYPPEMIVRSKTPLAAKILAVADSFDVMTTGRRKEYEIKRTPQKALQELEEDLRFEPVVVSALGKVLKNVRFNCKKLRKEINPYEWFGWDPPKRRHMDELRHTLF